jgi:3,4-dihydroxy 2-butanone 4-phosphate synthase/GTP cyclohydrolase II
MGMNGARAPPTLSTLRHSNYISVHVGLSNIRLVTNNPRKIVGIEGYGLEVVERVPIEITPQDSNVHYLRTKKTKLGHLLKTGLAVP